MQKLFRNIAVRCFPWTVFDLLGLPSGKGGVCIFEHPIAQLQPILNELILADRVDEALDQVKQYFLNVRSEIAMDSMLFKAGVAMRRQMVISGKPGSRGGTCYGSYIGKKIQAIFWLYS